MKIVIVGTGYVGLVTGVCFADVGVDVCCVDVDQEKIERLNQGILPIYEQGLVELLAKNYKSQRLTFSTDLVEALKGAEVVFSAVGTPPEEDGSADLSYVLQVAQTIGENITEYVLVVTKSTVPVGTAQKVKDTISVAIAKRGVNIAFEVASNPEFLKEGSAVKDFLYPERIVVGVESERAKELMSRLYKPFTLNGHPIVFMDVPSAEMTKYASNAMLATRISFMNDIANLCEIVGADISLVRKGIGSDSRIGSKFLYPGVGYGGSCFPKDVKALVQTAKNSGYRMRVLESVEEVNDDQKSILFKKFSTYYKGSLAGKQVAVWGLAFKPGTDDMREAPALVLIDSLLKAGCSVKAYDPVAMPECKRRIGDCIEYMQSIYQSAEGVDAIFLMTEWTEFRFPEWRRIRAAVKTPLLLDGRNIFDKNELKTEGFEYCGIGIGFQS